MYRKLNLTVCRYYHNKNGKCNSWHAVLTIHHHSTNNAITFKLELSMDSVKINAKIFA